MKTLARFSTKSRHFEHGLVEGICRDRRLAGDRRVFVKYEDGSPLLDLTCTLTVFPLSLSSGP